MDASSSDVTGQPISAENVAPAVMVANTDATQHNGASPLGHYTNTSGGVMPFFHKDDIGGIVNALKTHGVCIVKKLIPAELCEAVIAEGWDFLNQHAQIYEQEISSWANMHGPTHGFAEIYGTPTMFRVRVYEPLIRLWQQLHGTRSIWVGMDRWGCKPPLKEEKPSGTQYYHQFVRPNLIHTDLNPWFLPKIDQYQGLVALRDTAVDQGGFACIPNFNMTEYRKANEHRAPPQEKKFNPLPKQNEYMDKLLIPPFEQGDYVIWHSATPHCGTANVSDKWRYALYIRYFPAYPEESIHMKATRSCVLQGKRPENFTMGGTTPTWNANWEEGKFNNEEFLRTLNDEQLAVLGLRDWNVINPSHDDELGSLMEREQLYAANTRRTNGPPQRAYTKAQRLQSASGGGGKKR